MLTHGLWTPNPKNTVLNPKQKFYAQDADPRALDPNP